MESKRIENGTSLSWLVGGGSRVRVHLVLTCAHDTEIHFHSNVIIRSHETLLFGRSFRPADSETANENVREPRACRYFMSHDVKFGLSSPLRDHLLIVIVVSKLVE